MIATREPAWVRRRAASSRRVVLPEPRNPPTRTIEGWFPFQAVKASLSPSRSSTSSENAKVDAAIFDFQFVGNWVGSGMRGGFRAFRNGCGQFDGTAGKGSGQHSQGKTGMAVLEGLGEHAPAGGGGPEGSEIVSADARRGDDGAILSLVAKSAEGEDAGPGGHGARIVMAAFGLIQGLRRSPL